VHRDRCAVVGNFQHHFKRIRENDLVCFHRYRPNGNQPIAPRIKPRRFRVQNDEPYLFRRCLLRPARAKQSR
jgi:hypothetical protein